MKDHELKNLSMSNKVYWSVVVLMAIGLVSLMLAIIPEEMYIWMTGLKGKPSARVAFGSVGFVFVILVCIVVYLHRDTFCACCYQDEEEEKLLSVEVDSQKDEAPLPQYDELDPPRLVNEPGNQSDRVTASSRGT